jgi:hypothetical protein
MATSFDAGHRNELQAAAARGEPLVCPVCGVPLSEQAVDPKPELPYVRRRLWLLCPHCRRSAAIDLPHRRHSRPHGHDEDAIG